MAHGPAGLHVELAPDPFRGLGRELLRLRGDLPKSLDLRLDVGSLSSETLGQLEPSLEHLGDLVLRLPGAGLRVPNRPLAGAALRGRFVQGDVLVPIGRVDFDLVEVEVARARKLEADVACPGPAELGHHRLAVAVAVEDRAVVLVELLPGPGVVRGQHEDAGVSGAALVAAVVQDDAVEAGRLAEIDLPPGVRLI